MHGLLTEARTVGEEGQSRLRKAQVIDSSRGRLTRTTDDGTVQEAAASHFIGENSMRIRRNNRTQS